MTAENGAIFQFRPRLMFPASCLQKNILRKEWSKERNGLNFPKERHGLKKGMIRKENGLNLKNEDTPCLNDITSGLKKKIVFFLVSPSQKNRVGR